MTGGTTQRNGSHEGGGRSVPRYAGRAAGGGGVKFSMRRIGRLRKRRVKGGRRNFSNTRRACEDPTDPQATVAAILDTDMASALPGAAVTMRTAAGERERWQARSASGMVRQATRRSGSKHGKIVERRRAGRIVRTGAVTMYPAKKAGPARPAPG